MNKSNNSSFFLGFLFSLVGHLSGAAFAILALEDASAKIVVKEEIFSVTLEGGEKLGGITQIPTEETKTQKIEKNSAPDTPEPEPEKESKSEPEPVAKKKLEAPSAVEDPAEVLRKKKEAEKKKKEAERKKKKEEAAKKKKEAERRKKEEEKKRKAKEKADKKRKSDRNKALRDALARAKERRYKGESVDAGGQGLGAARLGGKGGGGGKFASIQKLRYDQALNEHVKRGWKWIAGRDNLTAVVRVSLDRDGTILRVEPIQSSGNENFDNSVVRAVQKASPVPAPPPNLYEAYYRFAVITFKSRE